MDDQIDYTAVLRRGDPVLATYRIPGTKAAKTARADVAYVEGRTGGGEYRSFARPVDYYERRGYITEAQHKAGLRYFKLWNYSLLHARYARMNYGDVGGDFDPVDHALVPRQYLDAQKSISDDRARKVVFEVCCMDMVAGKRGGMAFLRSGLDDLLKHFRRADVNFRIDN